MLLKLKPILFAPTALLLSVSLTCAAASDRIVIGQAVDLTGPDASIGRDYAGHNENMDLGGMSLMPAKGGNRLSGYIDIALFRMGNGLMF